MAIKSITGSYIKTSETSDLQINSNFFTNNTKIGAKPMPLTLNSISGGHLGNTSITRTQTGDPAAHPSAMMTPVSGITFTYNFDSISPNFYSSTFFQDVISISTQYIGSISHPVTPSLAMPGRAVGSTYIANTIIAEPTTITGPRIIAGKELKIIQTGIYAGKILSVNYTRNGSTKTESVNCTGSGSTDTDPNTTYSIACQNLSPDLGFYNSGSDSNQGIMNTNKNVSLDFRVMPEQATVVIKNYIAAGVGFNTFQIGIKRKYKYEYNTDGNMFDVVYGSTDIASFSADNNTTLSVITDGTFTPKGFYGIYNNPNTGQAIGNATSFSVAVKQGYTLGCSVSN